MNTRRRMSRPSRFLEDLPEDGVITNWTVAKNRRRIITAESRQPPESRAQPPNFSESSIREARSRHPLQIRAPPPPSVEFSSIVPSSNRPESPSTWDNPTPFDDENENSSVPHHVPAPPARIDSGKYFNAQRESRRQRISSAMQDIWLEVKSRMMGDSKLERETRKVQAAKRRDSLANTRKIDAGLASQIKTHREKQERLKIDALTKAKQIESEIKARAKRKRAAEKRSKEQEKMGRKEEKLREKEEMRTLK
ncbi:hypothetical protein SBOR_2345 [Sclerotinia borealis F-4128]|uniref:Uncharacterized protein n=1 Tax=Sclerotinia borealis (strain F-4128) TaxID=1432307 RepID=W9CN50_SCLBF|nr:hypothetical protein SBOR_2345 [Sclerotinia borealis F-4128]